MLFSVIIPTYNRLDLLEKAIKSVSNQTYNNYEIIVVNDNPGEEHNVNALISKYEKTKVYHHSYSKGGNAARNTGILNSSGDFIAFLDDDDVWLPEKLSAHLKQHQEKPNAGLVYSDCLYVYNNKLLPDTLYSAPVPVNVTEQMGRAKFCPATSSIVSIKKECVEQCGMFDESLVSFQDWDYWFRIAHNYIFMHIPTVLVHYTQHLGDRTSQNEDKRRKGLNQICDKWKKEINVTQFKKNSIISIYYKNSRNALLSGAKLTAVKESFKLLNTEIFGIKSVKSFVKVLLQIIFNKKSTS